MIKIVTVFTTTDSQSKRTNWTTEQHGISSMKFTFFTRQTVSLLLPFAYHVDPYFVKLNWYVVGMKQPKPIHIFKNSFKKWFQKFILFLWKILVIFLKKLLLSISNLKISQSSVSFYFSLMKQTWKSEILLKIMTAI